MLRRLIFLVLIGALTTPLAVAGGYIGVGTGQATQKTKESSVSFDVHGDTTGWKVFGGYNFLKFFGLEASYVDFGEIKDQSSGSTLKTSATALDLFAVGKIPLGFIEPFGKIGYASVKSKASATGLGSASDRGWDKAWGVGVGFNLLKKLHVRVEYEQYDISPDYNGTKPSADLYMLSAGAAWRF